MTSKEAMFDEFIESYDRSLNKDTSTITTIIPGSSPNVAYTSLDQAATLNSIETQQTPDPESHAETKMTPSPGKEGVVSPILSTPTKTKRNSVSLDKQPLKTETSDKPVTLIQSKASHISPPQPTAATSSESSPTSTSSHITPKTQKGHQRQVSISTVSGKKKGFNLNLALNPDSKNPPVVATRPRTPSNSISPLQRKLSLARPTQPQADTANQATRARSSSLKQVEDAETFNNALRELAAKEMRIFEIKSEIKLLTETLEREQDDLAVLRNQISTSLYKDMNSMKSPPASAVKQAPKPVGRDTTTSMRSSTPPPEANTLPSIDTQVLSHDQPEQITPTYAEPTAIASTSQPPQASKEVKASRRISQYFAKPITFMNQFDQILQNEFDKLNTTTPEDVNGNPIDQDFVNSSSTNSYTNTPASSKHNSPLKQVPESHERQPNRERSKTDEVLKTVSNSIWSFMSEVKSGLLGEEENAMFLNHNQYSQSQNQDSNSNNNQHGYMGQIDEDGKNEILIDDNGNTTTTIIGDRSVNPEQEMVTIRKLR
ncbi:hypothetical protein WICPIJ_007439 [Wickerhamomyces pijperi]|uniref:Topoisomerase I damage affected protein 11 n=1 Tax=Wickerhamomyces pijperi TaxID=599730 RepID=A0A9P8Q1K5_WICPI|nr:hypothetical protein WICPIJ_007439 [Wickerhamomyces pijperi]